jgi:hypothetical protein
MGKKKGKRQIRRLKKEDKKKFKTKNGSVYKGK